MKTLLRRLLLYSLVIFTAALILPGLSYSNDPEVLALAASTLVLVNLLVRPLVKLITLPINFFTLGVFSWLINVLMLLLVTKLIPGFSVSAFALSGFKYGSLVVPSIEVPLFWSYVLASFTISFLMSLFERIFD